MKRGVRGSGTVLGLVGIAFVALTGVACGRPTAAQETGDRPNILWLTCEDMSPNIGPYGDTYATTPNLDRFATRGLRYLNAWSNAPVCAPARTVLISGMYGTSTGAEHMRSQVRLPAGYKMYPQFLREAGYYCTNNAKEDYNLEKPGQVWDESSARAHWKNRKQGQPFFAVFNNTITHESQVRKRPHRLVHDPAKAPLPAYHPDTPEVRRDWAQYYDNITTMDEEVGKRLQELQEAGLAENTIVFFYSDHGAGMPRSKRWPYNSGLQVPLIVHVPEKYRHLAPKDYRAGGTTSRLVSFVDFAPTLLSLVGLKPAGYHQGHAFMGKLDTPPQRYAHGFRGRMDERVDLVRSVRDERYVYIRNYMPHRIYGQYLAYMFETPTTRVWKELYDGGKLNAAQSHFWKRKPPEELYDLQADPYEVNNLAASREHREVLTRMRKAQQDQALKIRDLGFLPEGEMHQRAEGSTPYELGQDKRKYRVDWVLTAADTASRERGAGSEVDVKALKHLLEDTDSAVRYWAATGLLGAGEVGVTVAREALQNALADPSPSVRIPAAEALARYGTQAEGQRALATLLELAAPKKAGVYVSISALIALDELDGKAAAALPVLKQIDPMEATAPPRAGGYVPRLLEKIVADLEK